MELYKDRPGEGDLVVVKISDVDKNSAYADLEEYEGMKGLIHVSEIKRSWADDARKELSEGQKDVAMVVEEGDTPNLSLKRVNEKQKKDTMERWNKEQKAEKFLDELSQKTGRDGDQLMEDVIFPMQREFGSSFTGFEVSAGEEERLEELFDDGTVEAIREVAEENIDLRQEKFEGEIELEFGQSDGVSRIREVFKDLGEFVEVKYVSAPEYSIEAWGRNKELAKRHMDEAVETIRDRTSELDGEFSFSKA